MRRSPIAYSGVLWSQFGEAPNIFSRRLPASFIVRITRPRVSNLLTGITVNLRLRNGTLTFIHECQLNWKKDIKSARNFSFLQNRSFSSHWYGSSMKFYPPSELLLTPSFATDYFTHVVQVIEGSRRCASRCCVLQCCIYCATGSRRQWCSSSSQSWERYRLHCMRGGFFVYSTSIATKSNQFP